MIATLDTLIYQIKPVREHFVRLLSAQNVLYAGYAAAEAAQHQSSAVYDPVAVFNALMNLPVSKLSVLRDPVWDFNDEAEPVARLIEGSKSRIDFTKYPSLNSTILFELKIAFMCAFEMPGAIRRGERLVTPKPHTLCDIFKALIPFYDKMCERKRREQGDDFFELSYYSLADFREKDYLEEAKVHDRAFRNATNQGFKYLRSHFLLENLFSRSLPYVEMHTLEWKQNSVTNPKKKERKKYLSNRIFEKCSRKAAFVVVDFLKALKETIHDEDGLERVTADGYNAAAEAKLTRKNFDIYVAIRMSSRGYTGKEIEPFLYSKHPDFWSLQSRRDGMFKNKDALCLLTKANIDDVFYQYLTHVSNSAYYVIGQYTGMRPSELSGIMAEGCLDKDEFGHNLILSTVIKNRELAGKLFGDKWAAIPIVMDAVRTLQILNRFKQHRYLLANMNTIASGEQDKAKPIGNFTYVLCAFLAEVLEFDELEELDVSAYTLRHSLAHQMMRAAVGLPFVSYQLKHFGNAVGAIGQHRMSAVTIDYGGIGDALTADGGRAVGRSIRHEAELELVMNTCDPDGSYVGVHAGAYRKRLKKYYDGYIEAGYTKEEIFDRMVENDFAIINVGQGFCYGEATEEFDVSLPCIGSIRCNPNRCKNAFVTKANAPKWREVYTQNTIALKKLESPGDIIHGNFNKSAAQLKAVIEEAKAVLESLGEELVV